MVNQSAPLFYFIPIASLSDATRRESPAPSESRPTPSPRRPAHLPSCSRSRLQEAPGAADTARRRSPARVACSRNRTASARRLSATARARSRESSAAASAFSLSRSLSESSEYASFDFRLISSIKWKCCSFSSSISLWETLLARSPPMQTPTAKATATGTSVCHIHITTPCANAVSCRLALCLLSVCSEQTKSRPRRHRHIATLRHVA